MKSVIRIFDPAAFVALLLFMAPSVFAQQVTLQLNNPPSNNILDSIYVGSYSATNTQTGAATQIICDDFQDNSDYNKTTYNVNTFSSLGSTMWGSYLMSKGGSLTQVTQLYEEAAWLALAVIGQTGTQQAYYSYALWAVFSPSQVAAWLTSAGDMAACNAVFGNNCTNTTKLTSGLLYNAQQNYASGNYSNFLILDPQGCSSPGTCKEQEFFEIVPEAGTAAMYLALAAFSCFAGMLFRSRRQRRRIA